MGETVEDAIGPAADTDSGTGTTTWHLIDHNEQGYGWQKSPGFNAAKCKDIRTAAKNADQTAFNAACIAAASPAHADGPHLRESGVGGRTRTS